MTGHAAPAKKKRIASIDWMRGVVMILMVVDHASMAFNGQHLNKDSAAYADVGTMALPPVAFLTRWVSHLCAPTFVFLAGTALAISLERKVARGADPWEIDKGILVRGLIIALLDPTLVSLGSGRWTLQVLLAIGVGMMLMAPLRRLPTWGLLAVGIGWIGLGELVTGLLWTPPGYAPPGVATVFAVYGSEDLVIKYPVVPWLSMMVLGWAFGRYLVQQTQSESGPSPKLVLLGLGVAGVAAYATLRFGEGYGNMFIERPLNSWQSWLFVSKYPPSAAFSALQLGLLCLCLAGLMSIEPIIGVRRNGPLLVFGQTAMFFYLVHRLVLEVPASWFGLRGRWDLEMAYGVSFVLLALLYPACVWYRSYKAAHPESWLKYF